MVKLGIGLAAVLFGTSAYAQAQWQGSGQPTVQRQQLAQTAPATKQQKQRSPGSGRIKPEAETD